MRRVLRIAILLLCSAAWPGIAADQWTTYTYLDDGFAADFPSAPQVTDDTELPSGVARVRNYIVGRGNGAFAVIVNKVAHDISKGNVDQTINNALKSHVETGRCKGITGLNKVAIPGAVAWEATLEGCNDLSIRKRIIVIGNFKYDVGVAGDSDLVGSPDAERFLQSFRHIPGP